MSSEVETDFPLKINICHTVSTYRSTCFCLKALFTIDHRLSRFLCRPIWKPVSLVEMAHRFAFGRSSSYGCHRRLFWFRTCKQTLCSLEIKRPDLLLILKYVRRMKGSKRKTVHGQIFEKAANLWPYYNSRGIGQNPQCNLSYRSKKILQPWKRKSLVFKGII